jgi:hypothetical protein
MQRAHEFVPSATPPNIALQLPRRAADIRVPEAVVARLQLNANVRRTVRGDAAKGRISELWAGGEHA